jgi:hypothetical protein
VPPSPKAAHSLALDHYDRLVALLADRVRSVVRRYQTGAYIVGRPGAGKTHTVRRVLDDSKTNHVFLNGRVSPAALFDEIAERPDSLLVIDDVSSLFKNLQAAQILMAAVGGDPGTPRRVTYQIKSTKRTAHFSGGLIAICNRPLGHDPVASALASRLVVLEHEPTDEMLIAFMESQARKGVSGIPAKECLAVFEFVVDVSRAGDYRIDLRNFFKGLDDYRCWKSGECEMDWKALVKSGMRQVPAGELPPGPLTRAGTKSVEYEIVQKLHDQNLSREELEKKWREQTGKSMDSYYRRKREMGLR